jgi:hypothetical protein
MCSLERYSWPAEAYNFLPFFSLHLAARARVEETTVCWLSTLNIRSEAAMWLAMLLERFLPQSFFSFPSSWFGREGKLKRDLTVNVT